MIDKDVKRKTFLTKQMFWKCSQQMAATEPFSSGDIQSSWTICEACLTFFGNCWNLQCCSCSVVINCFHWDHFRNGVQLMFDPCFVPLFSCLHHSIVFICGDHKKVQKWGQGKSPIFSEMQDAKIKSIVILKLMDRMSSVCVWSLKLFVCVLEARMQKCHLRKTQTKKTNLDNSFIWFWQQWIDTSLAFPLLTLSLSTLAVLAVAMVPMPTS